MDAMALVPPHKRRLVRLRAALGEWGRQTRRDGAWRGLVQGSDVAVAHQRVDAAMHAWRAFAADAARRAQHDQLAAIAGPGTALRRQRERLAQGFGTWHEVCVLALPPVMRQLLHARRRLVQAEQAQEADARRVGQRVASSPQR